ncbi:Periplasmic serine endoprotease DegP precursor [Maioricimonas rarisocia]|uniref:Periplasmic serine endoprotease DegP n=1 Tax=Maioricimonas rarisocia TaxID=2528026 RepID=A0A517Z5T5_9PLAN|nr:Do family serine endopeptidase [Maioricimonas rarisocia]QDU37850.1 Periplasmic serine endoprotease DegP precursor [Maioricimonas rarisocia]
MERYRKSWRPWVVPTTGLAMMTLAAFIVGPAAHDVAAQPLTETEQQAIGDARSLSTAFRVAVNRVMPSVVMIQTAPGEVQTTASDGGRGTLPEGLPEGLMDDPMFRRFFKEMPRKPQQRQPRRQMGTGSGVIIDSSGIVLTNNHVVEGGGKVTVRLHDGREFEAVEVHTDPKTDLAVVKIEGAGSLPAATLGDSDAMEIGDWVLAVGAPFGLRETVTAGIISAKARGIGITEREEFLQTDAAINPGNSGGPLVNLEGQIVGINTAISTASGGYDGVGFAIPVNLAKWVSTQLVEDGKVQRAFLGVSIQEVTAELADQLELDGVEGAAVTEVHPDTPAANAGLKPGDVIVAFDDQVIRTTRDLQKFVEQADLDADHELTVVRDGKTLTLDVDVKPMVGDELAKAGTRGPGPASEFDEFGMELSDLTGSIAEQLGLEETEGVVITSVESGSVADEAGLKAGMVIRWVGSRDVANVDDFRNAVEGKSLEKGILLLVSTGDASRFLVLKQS